MPVTLRIPSPLRSFTNGVDRIESEAADVQGVLGTLQTQCAGLPGRLFKAPGLLNRFINIYVNDEDIRYMQDLKTPVQPGDEVSIVLAVAGG